MQKINVDKKKIKRLIINIILMLVVFLILILSIEFIARIFYLGEGHYAGFDHEKGYYKFKPNQVLSGLNNATINSQGFRGNDIEVSKNPDTYRIVCLGASSTFGYYNDDATTYPLLLENLLNKDGDDKFEVINAGIPYSRTTHQSHMFENEIIDLNPDMIIVYTGFNDASYATITMKITGKIYKWLFEHSEVAYIPQKLIKNYIQENKEDTGKKIIGTISEKEFLKASKSARAEYRKQISKIIELAIQNNIKVVLVTQAAGVYEWSDVPIEISKMTYYEKKSHFMNELSKKGEIETLCAAFLVHTQIMEELEKIAIEYNIPIVDAIRDIDNAGNLFVSHVHLSAEGNKVLAESIYNGLKSENLINNSG